MSSLFSSPEAVAAAISQAFAHTPPPRDGDLVRSQGDEPAEVENLFRGRTDWRAIPAALLDQAGAASPSALSFFSDSAFRFFLPAYLVADLRGELRFTDPLFYLYHGLDVSSRDVVVHLPGGAQSTWGTIQRAHLAPLTSREAAAVVAYLRFKLAAGPLAPHEHRAVTEALTTFWEPLAGTGSR